MDLEKEQNQVNKDNPMNKRKEKLKRCKLSLYGMFVDFVSNTTLHGLRYLNESISVIEKVFWFITFIISIGLCSYLMSNVWHKWQHSPVIVTFNEEMVPVWKVPFPAVTICPQMKCKKTIYNYTIGFAKHKQDITYQSNDSNLFYDINTVCEEYYFFNIKELYKNSSLIENIRKVAPDTDGTFYDCEWRQNMENCSLYFKEVLTKEGVCFTFNTLSENEMFHENSIQKEYKYIHTIDSKQGWSITNGYTVVEVNETYPRMGQENGAKADLDVLLKERLDDIDHTCNVFNSGFKIYVHHPADMPQSSLYYYSAVSDQVTALAVKIDMVSTSDTLKSYSTETRQCHFPSDLTLKYFRHYTQSNCELECISNYTYSKCGCVWFNMPYSDSSHICTIAQIDCVNQAKDELRRNNIKSGLLAGVTTEACNCLPPCDSVSYDAEVLKTYFGFKSDMKYMEKTFGQNATDIEKYNFSRLIVYFKEPRFVSRRRSELYGTSEFLANCGGLLGLFLGFSFLSLIEILYFSTLRVCCLFRRNRRASRENVASEVE